MLRNRFTYSNVVATLALMFAMSGGAYAASKFLITSTKQIKPSVLASLKGKAGANGAPGAQGPAGAVGPAGGVGPQGPVGTAGANGEPGPEGKEGKAGKNGKDGATGFTERLPSGKTETGTFAFNATTSTIARNPIGFAIPLAVRIENEEPEECGEPGHPACVTHIFIFEGEAIPAGCNGTVEKNRVTSLTAGPGNFCLWVAEGGSAGINIQDPETGAVPGVGRSGAVTVSLGSKTAHGIWAVTAP